MYSHNASCLNLVSDSGELVNQLSEDSSGILDNWMSVKQSLMLDSEKGELVKASGRVGQKIGISEAKTMAALKSHSEAERRRRERINAHLTMLRGFLSSNEKMDKAKLLAEVIREIKQLKKTAAQASKAFHIPLDTDEVEVERLENNADDGSFLLRASLCCDYRPNLLSNVKQTIDDLPVRLLKCEVSTLGGRVKIVFFSTTSEEENSKNAAAEELILSSVRGALSNVLDRVSASAEYDLKLFYPQKRKRVSYFDSSCSSS